MNQIQIENLSTEEYSYFLGHGVIDYMQNRLHSLPLKQHLGDYETVTVQMSESCHKALKMYAVLKNKTVSEVSYSMMRAHIHKEAYVNEQVKSILDFNGIALDNSYAP